MEIWMMVVAAVVTLIVSIAFPPLLRKVGDACNAAADQLQPTTAGRKRGRRQRSVRR